MYKCCASAITQDAIVSFVADQVLFISIFWEMCLTTQESSFAIPFRFGINNVAASAAAFPLLTALPRNETGPFTVP